MRQKNVKLKNKFNMGLVDSFEKLRSVFEQNEKVIEPRIVKLFRFLNE
jgi:hypothetical protein